MEQPLIEREVFVNHMIHTKVALNVIGNMMWIERMIMPYQEAQFLCEITKGPGVKQETEGRVLYNFCGS